MLRLIMLHLPQLAIVNQGSRVLLGQKKRGFGEGYYNGFGGKVEPGETVAQAAAREVRSAAAAQCKPAGTPHLCWPHAEAAARSSPHDAGHQTAPNQHAAAGVALPPVRS